MRHGKLHSVVRAISGTIGAGGIVGFETMVERASTESLLDRGLAPDAREAYRTAERDYEEAISSLRQRAEAHAQRLGERFRMEQAAEVVREVVHG